MKRKKYNEIPQFRRGWFVCLLVLWVWLIIFLFGVFWLGFWVDLFGDFVWFVVCVSAVGGGFGLVVGCWFVGFVSCTECTLKCCAHVSVQFPWKNGLWISSRRVGEAPDLRNHNTQSCGVSGSKRFHLGWGWEGEEIIKTNKQSKKHPQTSPHFKPPQSTGNSASHL